MNEKENFLEISITKLKTVVETFIAVRKPILIHSKPGIGKSTVIRELAKEKGWEFVDIRPSQMPAEEIGGIPVPEKDAKTNLYRMIKALPAIYPIDENSQGILFLDELTTCREDVQNALLQLCQERTLTGVVYNGKPWKLPEKWIIISACNDLDSNQYGTELSQPLNNRFAHIFLSSNPATLKKDFLQYANNKHFNTYVINFIRNSGIKYLYENEMLENGNTIYATPRTWETISDILNYYEKSEKLKNVINSAEFKIILRSLTSENCTKSFLTYLQTTLEEKEEHVYQTFSQVIQTTLDKIKILAYAETIPQPDSLNNIISPQNTCILNNIVTKDDENNIENYVEQLKLDMTAKDYGYFLMIYISFLYYSNIRAENKTKLIKLLKLHMEEYQVYIFTAGIRGRDFIKSKVFTQQF